MEVRLEADTGDADFALGPGQSLMVREGSITAAQFIALAAVLEPLIVKGIQAISG